MAEKTIGLRLTLNGVDKTITDIKTFEQEIKLAREDLKSLEIGSTQFKKLSTEIGLAESQLLGLIQSTKRLTKEREIEGIGKLGQGVASSFAAATAAVSLFGNESEEVQKAATAAQNLLTLALSARGLAEVKLGAQLVARTIAERAATAATAAQGTALEGLYAIMAANPYGVILTAIGALIAAYVALGSTEDKEIEKTKTLNELRLESAVAAEIETQKIELLTEIINDSNVSLLAREGAYRQLQKLVPELTELSLKEAQSIKTVTGQETLLNDAIATQTQLIKLRAEQKALESFIEQKIKKDVEKTLQQRDQYIKSLSVEINQLQVRLAQQGLSNEVIQQSVDLLIAQKTESVGLLSVDQQLKKVTTEIVALEEKQNKNIDSRKKGTKDIAKAEKERTKQLEALVDLLSKQIELENQLLFQTFKLGDADAQITKDLQGRVDKTNELKKSLDKVKTITELLAETEAELTPIQDKVGEAFLSATKAGETYFDLLDTLPEKGVTKQEQLNKGLEVYRERIKEIRIANEGVFTPEQLAQLSNIQLIYENLTKSLSKFVQIKPTFDTGDWEKELVDFALATGQILTDPYKRTEEELKKAKGDALLEVQKTEKEFIASFVAFEQKANEATINNLKSKGKEGEEAIKKLNETFEKQGAEAFANLQKQGVEILKFEDGVRRTNMTAKELNQTLIDAGPLVRRAFLVENIEAISKEYETTIPLVLRNEETLADLQSEIAKKTFDEKKKYAEAIEILRADLLAQGLKIEELSYEEQLKLLEKFLKKTVEAEQETDETRKKKRDKTLSDIQQSIEMFNDLVGQTSSLLQQKIAMDLDALENSYTNSLDSIVGDTEEANQKRLELTKQYETQKAQIEKQALIKSLQAQKLQALASAASAIIAAQELTPPFNFIQSALVAGVTAAQVSLIQQQIEQARSMAGGGLIFGKSHEMGGVYAGGGVNLEGGESVINRNSTIEYGGLLSTINQMGGGRPIIDNPSNSLMEERLVQAIAKTRTQPIRAYVLNSEITSGQAINRRLEELATL